jgi:glycine cleavage system aminomethyltransferase T
MESKAQATRSAHAQPEPEIPVLSVNEGRRVPINLRQSGYTDAEILTSTRIRKSPYWHKSHEAGCWSYSVYNRMYHPRAYVSLKDGGLMTEYEYLTQHVTIWNVAVERQIRVKGPDAADFMNLLITRDVHRKVGVNQCRYVILCNQYGGIINDPVLLRVAEDEFWMSISDSDVLLWAQGVNADGRFNCDIEEIDVAPVQIQGPKSKYLMEKLFGPEVLDIPYYHCAQRELDGLEVTLSRTGFSAEVGFEIYLHDASYYADRFWDTVVEAGQEFDIKVIAPSHVRRLEAGILSWGQDMDIENNPYEVGLGWQVDLSKDHFIGKQALERIHNEGVTRKLVGLRMGGRPLVWYNEDFYLVGDPGSGQTVGYISSCFFSPNLACNIALAMVPTRHAGEGTKLFAELPQGTVDAEVVKTPFVDPQKRKPAQKLRST